MISFDEARRFVNSITPLNSVDVPVTKALLKVLSRDVYSKANAPPYDSSLKDGYALKASSIKKASPNDPVELKVSSSCFAGEGKRLALKGKEAIRVTTGAMIPEGADAVIPQELTSKIGEDKILCLADTTEGRNILKKGNDISMKELVCSKGTKLTPPILGLLTGANIQTVPVYRTPDVLIIATGSELAEGGAGSASGKIFPSNRATISGWLQRFGIGVTERLCGDDRQELLYLVRDGLQTADVVLTSGGVLDGEKDLVVSVMEEAGVEFLFKRVRIGPGKGVCMGVYKNKLVFNLPGGPPSNYVAFVFVALPAILRLAGFDNDFPPIFSATSTADLKGRKDWTQFVLSKASFKGGAFYCKPILEESRLKRIAEANSILIIPEGVGLVRKGQLAPLAYLDL